MPMHNFKDIKITEDPKILQQILGKMPEAGNQVNIIYFNQIVQQEEKKQLETEQLPEVKGKTGNVFLELYLENLPEPRLKNLVREATLIAYRKFKNSRTATGWLGGNPKISYRLEGGNGDEEVIAG